MNRRKPSREELVQMITGGILTGIIALVLHRRTKTLAERAVYPHSAPVKPTADELLDELWALDLKRGDDDPPGFVAEQGPDQVPEA